MYALKLWLWRRILLIPWIAWMTNAYVLQQIAQTSSLELLVEKHKLSYFGRSMRRQDGWK